jgi:hypothetical protein
MSHGIGNSGTYSADVTCMLCMVSCLHFLYLYVTYAVLHSEPGRDHEETSAFASCRYVTKDFGKPHYTVPWLVGGLTVENLKAAALAYRQVSNKSMKDRTEIPVANWQSKVQPWYDLHLFPLFLTLSQIVRLMVDSGDWYLSGKWGNPGARSSLILGL